MYGFEHITGTFKCSKFYFLNAFNYLWFFLKKLGQYNEINLALSSYFSKN